MLWFKPTDGVIILHKATKVTLYENVIEQISTLISRGSYRQGDPLPSERQMAEELGVSRNTLREALKALGLIGVLEVKHGGGYFVSEDLNGSVITSSFKFISTERKEDVRDLFETRRILEAENAALAALRSTPELIEALENDEAGLRANMRNPEASSSYDTDYHSRVAKAAGNRMLLNFTNMLRWPLFKMMVKAINFGDIQLAEDTVDFHRKITTAIADKNPDVARRLMNDHILCVEETILRHLEEQQES